MFHINAFFCFTCESINKKSAQKVVASGAKVLTNGGRVSWRRGLKNYICVMKHRQIIHYIDDAAGRQVDCASAGFPDGTCHIPVYTLLCLPENEVTATDHAA